jgi:hypothetical protein
MVLLALRTVVFGKLNAEPQVLYKFYVPTSHGPEGRKAASCHSNAAECFLFDVGLPFPTDSGEASHAAAGIEQFFEDHRSEVEG